MADPKLSLVLLLVGALAGCGSSYSATLGSETPTPDGSTLTAMGGALHTGIALAFAPQVVKHDTWGDTPETDGVTVVSSNPAIVGVAGVTGGGKWVVWAESPGSAELVVRQDGNLAASIPVVVTDPD